MSCKRMRTLSSTGDDRAVAIAGEYVLLLGISLLIFTAVYIGFNSFSNTASSDALSEAGYRLAISLGDRISDAVDGDVRVSENIDMPERICGHGYLIYPSADGNSLCILVDDGTVETPLIVPEGVRIRGFMISVPDSHRMEYDPASKTLTIT